MVITPIAYAQPTITVPETSNVVVEFVSEDAGSDNAFGIYLPYQQEIFPHTDYAYLRPGTTVDLGVFTTGTELGFYIRHFESGNTWYMDPSRNSDGQNHVQITQLSVNSWQLRWEDLPGLGDRDFNDVVVIVRCGWSEYLHFRAWIDGSDYLYIQGGKVWYVHRNFQYPGLWKGPHGEVHDPPIPTYINSDPWNPEWPDNYGYDDHGQRSLNTYTNLDPSQSYSDIQISLTKIAGRGPISIIQYPSSSNNYTTIILLDDDPGWGPDWYEFKLYKYQPNQPPTAEANGPYMGSESSAVTFDASGSTDPDGDPLKYRWDFDNDGTWDTDWLSSPTASYTWSDDYSGIVKLEVSDGKLTDIDTASVTIDNVAPLALVSDDSPKDEGTPVTVTISQTDPGTDTFTYSFDWDNDGTYEIVDQTSPSAQHVFMNDGVYTVGVRVKDDDGGIGTTVTNLTILDLSPTAKFSWSPLSQNEGSVVQFTDESTSYPDNIVSWNWDFGDGQTSTDQNPAHTYGDNGVYTVILTVTDDDGSTDTTTNTVTINNLVPTASIDSVEQPNLHFILPYHLLTFKGSFTDPGWLDTHTSVWDFGDGTTLTGTLTEENDPPDATGTSTVTYAYSTPGEYMVVLTITDDDGGVQTATTTITVLAPGEALGVLNDYIQSLPDDAFKNNADQRKNAFSEKLAEVSELIESGQYQEAIDKLENDIRAKCDGSLGGNSKNDWIKDPEAQQEIVAMIDDLIAYLEALLQQNWERAYWDKRVN